MSDSLLIFNTMLGILANAVIREHVKRHADVKGRHRLVFIDNTIVHIRNPKESTYTEFSKDAMQDIWSIYEN